MVQLFEHITLAQVMISWFKNSSLAWGLLLSVQSPLQFLCPPLSLTCAHTLSLTVIKKHKKNSLKYLKNIDFLFFNYIYLILSAIW